MHGVEGLSFRQEGVCGSMRIDEYDLRVYYILPSACLTACLPACSGMCL